LRLTTRVPSARLEPSGELVLRAAVAAYLGRYRGRTRQHSESDLRVILHWCTDHELDPLTAVRVDIERYVRWLQDVRHYQPSTVSRRLSIVVGFYRVCVIDRILPHSPADYVRRSTVPADFGDLRQRRQDHRREPTPLAGDLLDALVIDS
jgi:hypothetical protein